MVDQQTAMFMLVYRRKHRSADIVPYSDTGGGQSETDELNRIFN